MAVKKDIFDAVTKKKLDDKWKELKNWVSSPGGLITIVTFIIVFIYVHHRTKD